MRRAHFIPFACAGALCVACLLPGCAGPSARTAETAEPPALRAVAFLPDNFAQSRAIKNGMELALERVNAEGGARALRVEFLPATDEALEAALKTAPAALWVAGDFAVRSAPSLMRAPTLAAFLTDYPPVPSLCPLGVRLYANGAQSAQDAFEIAHTTEIANVVILHAATNADTAKANYLAFLMRGDGIRTRLESFSDGESDFRLLAAQPKIRQADALYLVGDFAKLEPLARALETEGVRVPCIALYHTSAPPEPDSASARLLVYSRPKARLNAGFTRAYAARFGMAPDRAAAYGYENVVRLADAAARARSNAPKDLRDALLAGEPTADGAIPDLSFEHDGDTRTPTERVVPDGVVLPPACAPHSLLQPAEAPAPRAPANAPETSF